jgi:peptidoglycan/LPS O-acetylase OafA/YrhL
VGLLGFVALGLAQGPFDMHRPAMEIWSHSLLGLGFAGLTAGAVLGEGGAPAAGTAALRRVLLMAPLQALGRYSYGLYVVHYFVHRGALEALRASEAGRALLAGRAGYLLYAAGGAAASLALAVLSFHLLERRFLAWKRFFVARP